MTRINYFNLENRINNKIYKFKIIICLYLPFNLSVDLSKLN